MLNKNFQTFQNINFKMAASNPNDNDHDEHRQILCHQKTLDEQFEAGNFDLTSPPEASKHYLH